MGDMGLESNEARALMADVIRHHSQRFRENLGDTRAQLIERYAAYAASATTGGALDALHRLVHSLAGNGETLGLPEVSAAAAPLKLALEEQIKGQAAISPDAVRGLYERLVESLSSSGQQPD